MKDGYRRRVGVKIAGLCLLSWFVLFISNRIVLLLGNIGLRENILGFVFRVGYF